MMCAYAHRSIRQNTTGSLATGRHPTVATHLLPAMAPTALHLATARATALHRAMGRLHLATAHHPTAMGRRRQAMVLQVHIRRRDTGRPRARRLDMAHQECAWPVRPVVRDAIIRTFLKDLVLNHLSSPIHTTLGSLCTSVQPENAKNLARAPLASLAVRQGPSSPSTRSRRLSLAPLFP